MKQRTIVIAKPTQGPHYVQGQRATITIDTTKQSYFDPDGFSRAYNPGVAIRVFGGGKNMAYRNCPGTTFKFGKDFDTSGLDYCTGGYLWISEDKGTLGVALFDVKAPNDFAPLKDFNGSYRISEQQAQLLLK